MFSRYFASLKSHPAPEVRADASLCDLADAASRSLHLSSQQHKPSAQRLAEGLSPADRQETLVWIVQAFDVMHFPDSLLFDTSLLLDRYYALQPEEDLRNGGSQRKLLAAVCMALKVGCAWDTQLSLRQVVTHLGRDQVPFDEVMIAELAMLQKLRFDIGTPTVQDFLEALSTRLVHVFHMSDASKRLSEFLLQLTLGDATLHYRFPHAVLSASVLVLALCGLRASPAAHTALLEDLAVHCPEAANGLLAQCVSAVNALWVRSVSNEQSMYAYQVCQKFARMTNHAVSTVAPVVLPPTMFPAVAQGWNSTGCPSWKSYADQDDVDEAICMVHQSLSMEVEFPQMVCCPRCHKMGKRPGFCGDCGSAVESVPSSLDLDEQRAAALACRLRGPAESNWKVKSILVRHGWNNGRFRRLPDRDQLLRDLFRESKNKHEKAARRDVAVKSQAPSSTCSTFSSSGSSPTSSSESLSGRRRSVSCGQRPIRPQGARARSP